MQMKIMLKPIHLHICSINCKQSTPIITTKTLKVNNQQIEQKHPHIIDKKDNNNNISLKE